MFNQTSTTRELSLYHVAEMATLISTQGPQLMRGAGRIPDRALDTYWRSARSLQQRWMRVLTHAAQQLKNDAESFTERDWFDLQPVLEEVLVTDLMIRLWTGVLTFEGLHQGTLRTDAVARSVLIGHLQVRHEVLWILLHCPASLTGAVERIDQLRRRTERWADMLLGNLHPYHDVRELAFDEGRLSEFGSDGSSRFLTTPGSRGWKYLRAGLTLAFRTSLAPQLPLQQDFARLFGSVLAAFPADAFDGSGTIKSLLAWQIEQSSLLPEGPLTGEVGSSEIPRGSFHSVPFPPSSGPKLPPSQPRFRLD